MDIKRVFDTLLYFIILPFTAISFVLTPLTNDSRIFIGAEAIADRFYSLPYGWDAAYEVKPIGNRIVNWVLYKVANTFVPFIDNDYTHFGIVVKIAALVILVVCLLYVSRKIKFPYAFPFLFIAFACQANFGIIMSEWFAALFSLVAISLCFEENKNWMFIAGSLCLSIALLKSITVLMVVPIICAVYLLGGTIDWKRFIAGYWAAGFAFLALCLTVWPYSIGDMLMSRLVAHVGMHNPLTLLQWFWLTQDRTNLIQVLSFYVPVLIVGFIAGGYLFIRYYLFEMKTTRFVAFCLMWLAPLGIVFIQSEFIIYHYIVLMVPAIISIALVTRSRKNGWKSIIAAMGFILVGYILVNSVFGSFTTYEYTFWQQKEINADNVNAQFNLTNQSFLLYLDPGDASYYFHANSSCHYITPMPVERSTNEWNISYLPQFKDTHDCIMQYQGEYVVADVNNGLFAGFYGKGILMRKEIMDVLERNYTVVDNHSWTVYKKKALE
jgi:hypothetical protein